MARVAPPPDHPSHPPDPAEVEHFRKLVEARRRHDHRAAKPLYAELRLAGWLVSPVQAKRPGGAR